MVSKKIEIAPSILSADFRNLEREVKAAQDAGADRIHCDVMDGHFVPNITFGPLVIEAVKKCVSIPLDVHLMISDPQKYVRDFCSAGSDVLMFHAEAVDDIAPVLQNIKKQGVKTGITVNPDYPVDLFIDELDKIDQVLIMSVYAGFGGQKFMPEMKHKVKKVYTEVQKRDITIDIEVDGGVNGNSAEECALSGANVLVAGSYVFGSGEYQKRISELRELALKGREKLQV
ncbi:ribulose-phosphate 3-epimerase [Chitinispirillales bacterium ANBcel5]|uniref:ribulose-phosphate 3-epimerase n=1 Tax=Cellulosispirillum alkaliphilum TaxID=3039283 RepID=UPI002A5580F3|nr:ribulose-phosphate 3-epimerase [Chitinispirillales bacterium ANBcel5]